MESILSTDSGEITVDGEPRSELSNAIISYLPERTYLASWKTVEECLDYFCDFYEDFDRERAEKMLDELSVDKKAKMKTLSKGTKEKVQLILVMSRRAKLYLLDEPIAGVDPAAREYIIDTIIKNHSPESTILISTHLITDIENVLDDYLFIYNGQIFEAGNARTVAEEKGKSLDMYFREVFRYVW